MIATTITHALLSLDFRSDGNVLITKNDGTGSIILSRSEWLFLAAAAEIAGWPVAAVVVNQRDAPA